MRTGEEEGNVQPVMQKNDLRLRRIPGALRSAGFTLIELMIVITIIIILIGIAAGRYERAVQRAKEATLRSDLVVMRKAIDEYTLDKQAAPQSLDDLVQAQYLREVPLDPITRQRDWKLDMGDFVLSPEQTSTGVTDVHSNSDQTSPFEGTPYSSW
jgi:general secretion pathway protein G